MLPAGAPTDNSPAKPYNGEHTYNIYSLQGADCFAFARIATVWGGEVSVGVFGCQERWWAAWRLCSGSPASPAFWWHRQLPAGLAASVAMDWAAVCALVLCVSVCCGGCLSVSLLRRENTFYVENT